MATPDRTAPHRGRGWRLDIRAVPAGFAVLSVVVGVVLTAGLWRAPGARMIGPNVPDGIHYSWWLGRTATALGRGEGLLLTTSMNWPDGVSTMNNTTLLLPSLLLSPISLLTGPLVTLNLLNALAVPACALAAYWSARRLEIGRGAAVAGAAVFALSPAVVNSLTGHVTMAFAPALPILLVLSVEAWRGREPVRTGVLLGLVALAQVFTGEEVLFQAGVGAFLVLLVAAASRPWEIPRRAARLGAALGTAVAVFLPVAAYPLYVQFFGPLRQSGSPFLRDYYGADLTGFTTPTDRVWLHTDAAAAASARFAGGVEEHLAYLGWPLLITSVTITIFRWSDLRVRCAGVGLLVAGVLSLGGRIWIDGVWTDIRGPYAWLQALPVLEASLATRFGLLVALFAAALLALAVDAVARSSWRSRTPIAVALAACCVLPLVPRPLPTVDAPVVPPYFTSADRHLDAGDVVVVVPYPVATKPVAMRWQSEADHLFSMPGGYFLGPAVDGHAYVGGASDPPTARLLATVARTGLALPITAQDRARARSDLIFWGADAVVLGPDPTAEALRMTLTALLGRAPQRVDGVDVWTDPLSGWS